MLCNCKRDMRTNLYLLWSDNSVHERRVRNEQCRNMRCSIELRIGTEHVLKSNTSVYSNCDHDGSLAGKAIARAQGHLGTSLLEREQRAIMHRYRK